MTINPNLKTSALELLAALREADPNAGWRDATEPDHYGATLQNSEGLAVWVEGICKGWNEAPYRLVARWQLPQELYSHKSYTWRATSVTVAASRGGAALLKPLLKQAPAFIEELNKARTRKAAADAAANRKDQAVRRLSRRVRTATPRRAEPSKLDLGNYSGVYGTARVWDRSGAATVDLELNNLSPEQAEAVLTAVFGTK